MRGVARHLDDVLEPRDPPLVARDARIPGRGRGPAAGDPRVRRARRPSCCRRWRPSSAWTRRRSCARARSTRPRVRSAWATSGEGVFSENTGAALAICATVPAPFVDPARQMPCHYHGVPGLYMAHTFTSGGHGPALVPRHVLPARDGGRRAPRGPTPTTSWARRRPRSRRGRRASSCCPTSRARWRPRRTRGRRACSTGSRCATRRAHFARSIMEAIALHRPAQRRRPRGDGHRRGRGPRRSAGGPAAASGTRSRPTCLGIPVVTTEIEEAASLGAAILAGVCGWDLREPRGRRGPDGRDQGPLRAGPGEPSRLRRGLRDVPRAVREPDRDVRSDVGTGRETWIPPAARAVIRQAPPLLLPPSRGGGRRRRRAPCRTSPGCWQPGCPAGTGATARE